MLFDGYIGSVFLVTINKQSYSKEPCIGSN